MADLRTKLKALADELRSRAAQAEREGDQADRDFDVQKDAQCRGRALGYRAAALLVDEVADG